MAIRGGFQIAEAYIEVILDKDAAKKGVRDLPKDLDRDSTKAGHDTGDIFSRGLRMSIVRNSPLIAAAIGGAMAFGAPAVLAGATALFGGIAAVAAAQSAEVKTAWKSLWGEIRTGAQQDAAAIVPIFVGMAAKIGSSFETMRPLLRDAFAAVGPQIDGLVDSIMQMAENALPGMVTAVQNSGAAVAGLGSMLERVGTGLGDMMAGISEHSGPAGGALIGLGENVQVLLDIIGTLVEVGSEVASMTLPLLADALHIVAGALSMVEGILPGVISGFLAFRTVNLVAGWIKSAGDALTTFASKATVGGTAAGKMGGFLSSAGAAISRFAPAVGVAVAVIGELGSSVEENEASIKSWTQQVLAGGQQAADAWAAASEESQGWVGDIADAVNDAFGVQDSFLEGNHDAVENLRASVEAARAAMSPLAKAQFELTQAQDAYDKALASGSATADEVAAAHGRLVAAQNRLSQVQAEVARNAEDAATALERQQTAADNLKTALDALNGEHVTLAEAEINFQEAIDNVSASLEQNGRTLDITTEAGRANKQSLIDAATAASDLAHAYYDTTGDYGGFVDRMNSGRQVIIDQAMAMGASAEAAQALADDILRVPTELNIKGQLDAAQVQAELDEVKRKMDAAEEGATVQLGMLDNGTVDRLKAMGVDLQTIDGKTWQVTVTSEGLDNLHNQLVTDAGLLQQIGGFEARPNAEYDSNVPTGTAEDFNALYGLDDTTATPSADLESTPLQTAVALAEGALNALGLRHVEPSGGFAGDALNSGINGATQNLEGLDRFVATPTASLNNGPFSGLFASVMANVQTLASQTPTPVVSANPGPFTGFFNAVMANIRTLAGQTPTPVVNANPGPFTSIFNSVMANIRTVGSQNPRPTVTAIDQANGVINSIKANMASLQNKTVYITTVNRVLNTLTGGLFPGGATGGRAGEIARRKFAGGGTPRRRYDGKLIGPGGPLDDLINAITDTGEPIRVANTEWIVPGGRYDDATMRSIVAGTARILRPGRRPAESGGGVAVAEPVATTASGTTITVQNLVVPVKAILDPRDRNALRSLAQLIRQALLDLDREDS